MPRFLALEWDAREARVAVARTRGSDIVIEHAFAVALDIDYLRSGWFYQHMPFGGLRFNYPAPGFMTVFYVITTLVLAGANSLANRPAIRRPKP